MSVHKDKGWGICVIVSYENIFSEICFKILKFDLMDLGPHKHLGISCKLPEVDRSQVWDELPI